MPEVSSLNDESKVKKPQVLNYIKENRQLERKLSVTIALFFYLPFIKVPSSYDSEKTNVADPDVCKGIRAGLIFRISMFTLVTIFMQYCSNGKLT